MNKCLYCYKELSQGYDFHEHCTLEFFGKEQNSNTGSPFVFSNRNETKIIEDFVASYNKMDVDGMKNALAEEFTLDDYRGKKVKYKKSELDNFFKPFISVNWKLNAIIPIKIAKITVPRTSSV